MRTILFCLFCIISFSVSAQRECASFTYLEQIRPADPLSAKNITDAENFIKQSLAINNTITFGNTNLEGEKVIRIPVVVHVLYNTPSQNISDAQIKSQIDALNRDFRKRNTDTANIPAHFKNTASDVFIEFELATSDPNGTPTTGIIRKYTSVTEWTNDDKIKFASQGGNNAWDSKSYLNIWVGSMRRLLGYATVPGSAADKDGIVINTSAFGTINVAAPYNQGRTAVHEVGHWLGLKHIWGDTYCGDDGVSDTPKQGNYTQGCPNGFRSSCSNGEVGDMYMNYMDFTADACINLFTYGQKERMRINFAANGPRVSFLASKGLNTPWTTAVEPAVVAPVEQKTAINAAPNPVESVLTLNIENDAIWKGKEVKMVSMNGVVLQKVILTSKTQKISVSHLRPGIYLLQSEAGGEKLNIRFVKM